MSKVKVEGYSDYVRDARTGAVLNNNANKIEQAVARKMHWKKQQEEHSNLVEDVDDLKKEIGEIKNLLNKIVERL